MTQLLITNMLVNIDIARQSTILCQVLCSVVALLQIINERSFRKNGLIRLRERSDYN